MTDKFIQENNEKKAIKLVYKELLHDINVKILDAKRRLDIDTSKASLLLGINQYNVLYDTLSMSIEDDSVDISGLDLMHVLSNNVIKIWGMPIYVSPFDDDLVSIIIASGNVIATNPDGLFTRDKDNDYRARLAKYIAKLPENSIFKKVGEV